MTDTTYLKNINIDKNYINSIFNYNVKNLDSTNSLTLSKYAIALSQYLVYLKFSFNSLKSEAYSKKRFIDKSVALNMTVELIKRYKTKSDAREYLISTNKELDDVDAKIGELEHEIFMLDGIEKSIYELIACFKRELTRREKEIDSSLRG